MEPISKASRTTLELHSVNPAATNVDWQAINRVVNPVLSDHGILLILLTLFFLTLIFLWLMGLGKGNTVLDGKILPTGFPTYFIRNFVTSLALISLTLGTVLVARSLPNFEAAMAIFLYLLICSCFLASEALFEHLLDATGAGFAIALSGTATLFLLVLSWSSSGWAKLLLLVPLLWIIYLSISFLAFGKKNFVA